MLKALAAVIALSGTFSSGAQAYSATANVTFYWATGGTDKGWTSGGTNTLGVLSDATYFSQQAGNNSVGFYNSDFASAAGCAAAVADPSNTLGWDGGAIATRKYGCRFTDVSSNPAFLPFPVGNTSTPAPGIGPGPAASGTISVTDTTLTGTLTVVSTTDLPTGGTAANIGLGANGYNLRSADGSPFGNNWNGVTTVGTYQLNLTGIFTNSSWQITGGTARFTDIGFLCQQGGYSTPIGILCNASVQAGGYQTNGAALSWGWDLDGSGANTTMGEIEVRDSTGVSIVDTLSGVVANLSIDGFGNIITNQAEIRRAQGSSACGGAFIKWDGTRITCGTLTVANLVISGNPGLFFDAGNDGPISVIEGAAQLIPVGANDIGFTNPVTITVTTPPARGTITAISSPGPAAGMTITYTANPGESGADSFVYRVTDSAAVSDFATVTLAISPVPDAVPEAFTFTDQANVTFSTLITSNAITVTGINVPTAISVTGGEYSINGGAFTALAGTVSNGNTVAVRQASSPTPNTATEATITIGGVADTFTVTTAADSDSDGVIDPDDNCTLVANATAGTVPGTAIPRFQLDSDSDGYGNACDADLNNSGSVTATDYAMMRSVLGELAPYSPLTAAADMNGSGTVTATDYSMLRARIGTVPGPSGLHPGN